MKKILLPFLFLFPAIFAVAQSQLDTVRIQKTGEDGGIDVSTDDIEQKNNEIDKLYDDDLDIGWEGDEFNIVATGLRYRGVSVPNGATIDSAFIEMWAHEDEGDPALVTIYGEASDNPGTYNDTDLISDRPQTTASVFWEITEAWAIWEKYRTPDLKAIIQEIVDRPGWQPGNAMAFFLTGQDQGASAEDNARDFEAFENVADPDDGGDGLNHPERVSKLVIYYSGESSTKDLIWASGLKVAPNPVSGQPLRVYLDAFNGEAVAITLFDINGKALQSWEQDNTTEAVIDLDLQVAPGLYTVKVVSKTKVGAVKVVVK